MDFYQLKERELEGKKLGIVEVYPDFKIVRSKDLMVRGKGFYAIWDAQKNLWSTDEYDVQRLVDEDIRQYETRAENVVELRKKYLGNFSTNSWLQFRNYIGHLTDNSTQLDENLTFANSDVKKEDYVSRRLPYALADGDISAYDELMSVLYDPEERAKLEWAVGSIMAGDSKTIQKFVVLFGGAGTGKSTWLIILQTLTQGYYITFDAKALTGNNNAFSTEVFKSNPLVAIQHDGDLSRIEDNTKLNSIVSHEMMTMNEKYKPSYDSRANAFLFMGTNKPVKITDGKSGLIRRMIDVKPTGNKISPRKYQALMSQVEFELGAIAAHCLGIYREMGKDYYSGYRPEEMMMHTDIFFNFVEWHWDELDDPEGISLMRAYALYKDYCIEAGIEFKINRNKFREELKNYFTGYEDIHVGPNRSKIHGWYTGFNADKFKSQKHVEDVRSFSLVMDEHESIFDREMATMPAQYATSNDEEYMKFWSNHERPGKNGKMYIPADSRVVHTTLQNLDTTKEHYVKVPENHIVIDFDLRDSFGQKSAERNLEKASAWPSTYAEFSKSGGGIHLHYIYDGDVSELSSVYDDGIEVKVFRGDASLRRKLSRCNNVPVATISSGLPLKEKKMINSDQVKSEKALRELIERNLRKEIHAGTKSSVDFIHKILEDAYASDLEYDVTDMQKRVYSFANNSTNQALAALKVVQTMKFASEVTEEKYEEIDQQDLPLVIFDVEVFPNLFVVCWKYKGAKSVTKMINPTAEDMEALMKMRLIGFNNRHYDNHIIYARYLGYDNARLYVLSKKLIDNVPNARFGEAYNVSYTDLFDLSNTKMRLKQWELKLGLKHNELGLPWDKPVPPEKWDEVADYCADDVDATEVVLDYLEEDYIARQILSELSGLSMNATTQQHTARITFGDNRRPQEDFVYTDLSKEFKGYSYEVTRTGVVSTYRGEDPGEGGYVYAEPGMYENVVLLDIASMHPTTIEQLDLFGPYTKNYSEIKKARIALKRKDFETARAMFGGRLAKYLENTDGADALAYALKIVINIVYGLTSARFDNSFRDPRNIDNIVAKRGALFMIDLKHLVQKLGYKVIHIKTDSIKIVVPKGENPKSIIDQVMEYGDQFGYEFEHEATYEKICLVNDAVFVGKKQAGLKPAEWTATGAQFQQPYVFKKLFSHDPIKFEDKCEMKSVTTSLWLDFTDDKAMMVFANDSKRFIGKDGIFCPMKPGTGGGTLQREKEGKFNAATGTLGYEWVESDLVKTLKLEKEIDLGYFDRQVDKAIESVSRFGDFEWFVS